MIFSTQPDFGHLSELTSLTLRNFTGPSEELGTLRKLSSLTVQEEISLKALKDHPSLKRLIYPTASSQIDIIRTLTHLEELDIRGWKITNLHWLAPLTSLKKLHINGKAHADLLAGYRGAIPRETVVEFTSESAAANLSLFLHPHVTARFAEESPTLKLSFQDERDPQLSKLSGYSVSELTLLNCSFSDPQALTPFSSALTKLTIDLDSSSHLDYSHLEKLEQVVVHIPKRDAYPDSEAQFAHLDSLPEGVEIIFDCEEGTELSKLTLPIMENSKKSRRKMVFEARYSCKANLANASHEWILNNMNKTGNLRGNFYSH